MHALLLLGVLLTSLCAVSSSRQVFYFNPQPKDQNVVKGQSVTLECGVSKNTHILFYWTLNGEQLANDTRRYQQGSNLHFTRVDPQHDLGEFRCIATNDTTGFSLTSQVAQLNILWISEEVRVVVQSENLQLGQELILRCKAEGFPDVRVEWLHNGQRLVRGERVAARNRRLHVTSLRPSDNGIYTCRATNSVGTTTSVDNYVLKLRGEDGLQVVTPPQDVTLRTGDTAFFECAFENAAITEWYFGTQDTPLTNSSKSTLDTNGSLRISNVTQEDKGFYKCVGISSSSKESNHQTFGANLRLAYLGAFKEQPFEPANSHLIMVSTEQHFEVTCLRPDGHPVPRVWWTTPLGHIVGDTDRVHVDDTRLIIDRVFATDAGDYTCWAENKAGKQNVSIELYVTSPPTILMHPINRYVDEHESVHFECTYTGGSPYPLTTVRWLKDTKYIKGSSNIINPQNGTLIIKSASMTDAAEYICEVNSTGFPVVQSNLAALVVKEKLKFVSPPVNKNLELGSTTKIYCKARGSIPPVVRWIKEGLELFKWPSHVHDENGTLHFNGVQTGDAGKYTCVATSPQEIINSTIIIDVIVMPKFSLQPKDTEAYEGYPIMLHCQAKGDPHPTIKWDKNNKLIASDKRFKLLPNGTLLLSEAHMEDSGKYGCTAGNSGGFRRAEIMLRVESGELYNPDRQQHNVEDPSMTKTVLITLGAAAVYMVLVVGLMVWCRVRRARRKAELLAQEGEHLAKSEPGEGAPPVETTELHDKRQQASNNTCSTRSDSSGSSAKANRAYDKLHIPRHDLQTMILLGHGEFGEVFLAKTKEDAVVMVKSLQSREEIHHLEYKREVEMWLKLNHHTNVAKLVGVCRESEPFLMVTEYTDWGDLKQFLLATRQDEGHLSASRKGIPKPLPLSVAQAVGVCHQLAQGMEYLTNLRFTHGDLATRNCLVTSKLNIKISRPNLAKDTYAAEYFTYRNRCVPLRWAPSEALLDDEWSAKSDVWAFGVTVWEVFCQAMIPFSELTDSQVFDNLQSGTLMLGPPAGAPQALAQLLVQCWGPPQARPSFSEIVLRLGAVIVDSKV